MKKSSLVQFIQEVLPMNPDVLEKILAKFQPYKIKRNEHLLKEGISLAGLIAIAASQQQGR